MAHRTRKLETDELTVITKDARVVALRWDLVPWGLVLDLDCPISEAKQAPMIRAWIAFEGVSDMTWPFINVRLPTGCWLSSGIASARLEGQFTRYEFSALLPTFADDGTIVEKPSRGIRIKAQKLTGVASVEAAMPGESGMDRSVRVALCSDEELLANLGA